MLRYAGRLVVSIAVCVLNTVATAQPTSELISESTANAFGLHRAWFTRARASAGIGGVQSVVPNGDLLLVQTRGATIQAIESETGRTLWIAQVGNSGYSTMPPGGDSEFVAATNGQTLYVLRRATGNLVWQRRLDGSPNAGCAVGGGYVFVPMLDGRVEAYLLHRTNPVDATAAIHNGAGSAESAPVVVGKRVFWTTVAGDLYVDAVDSAMVRNRFRTSGPIVGGPSVWHPRVFVGSDDSFCYALKDDVSTLLWQFGAGGPIRQAPLPIDDAVYVVSEARLLSRVAAANGQGQWTVRGVSQVLAASSTRLYVSDAVGRLAVLDAKNGATLGVMPWTSLSLKVTNMTTDRIYLASESGTIVCLHEVQQTKPLVRVPPVAETGPPKPPKKAEETPVDGTAPATTPPADNPFGM